MNRLFGTSKQEPKTAPPPPPPKEEAKKVDLSEQAARQEAKVQELTSKINALDVDIADQYAKAKKLKGSQATQAKQRCVMILKKKKMYEQQLSQLMNNQLTLDQMAFTRENIQNTLEMTQAMTQQVELQKQMFKDVDMDAMEDLMEDMEDMKAESDYMNEMMNRNYSVDIDEDELDREMQDIDNEMYMEGLNKQQMKQPPAYLNNVLQSQKQSGQVQQNL